jgi:hypothetical protein
MSEEQGREGLSSQKTATSDPVRGRFSLLEAGPERAEEGGTGGARGGS